MSDNAKIRIGILGAADIAARRFIPAMLKCNRFEFAGVAVASDDERGIVSGTGRKTGTHKAEEIVELYGGKVYSGYRELLSDESIDAVYIPLPPSLHYVWGMEAVKHNKSIYMEKPFTTSYDDTCNLIEAANKAGVAVFENYVFDLHPQFEMAKEILTGSKIGTIRQIRCSFGFPYRGENDFRYEAALGGGAILDAGGYLIRCVSMLLGEEIEVKTCQLRRIKNHDVDGYGTAVVTGKSGAIAVLTFGMDMQYKCELELWGEKGMATFGRMYTPGPDFSPSVSILKGFETSEEKFDAVDTFAEGIKIFAGLVEDRAAAREYTGNIVKQAKLVKELFDKGTYE